MYFGANIKLLRKRRGRTQDEVAFTLGLKRPTLSGYENEIAQPDLKTLLDFSRYFKVSVDTLLKMDLSALPESQISQLEKGNDIYVSGSQLRVLATTIDAQNRENIELVGEKAKAGYASGFADPDFIRVLPTFQLPFLHRERKYRAFQISGDSMLPIPDGSWVIGEYIQNWNLLRDRHAYIVVTLEEGVVFKVVENRLAQERKLILHSLNPAYEPFDIQVSEIKEVWMFVHYISSELPEPNVENPTVIKALSNLEHRVKAIQARLDL